MKKWIIIAIVVAIVISIGMTLFKQSSKEPAVQFDDNVITIGASVPLTGESKSFGEFVSGGLELAVQEVNDAGGVNGQMIELAIEDDLCDPTIGASVFDELVNFDQVTAIVGPICSTAASTALPIAQEAGVPVITWGSAPALAGVGDYIFRTYPSDNLQGVFAADFIFDELGKRRVAVLHVLNDWGEGLADVFVERFTQRGGEVVFDEGIAPDAIDLSAVITNAKAANPDVVYAPWYPQVGAVAARQARELALNVPIVAGDAFSSAETLAVPEAEGILFTQPKTQLSAEFAAEVKSATGKDSNVFTPFAYDSIKILARVMERVGADRAAIRDELATLSYSDSVATPSVFFDQNGDLAAADFEVMVVQSGNAVPYQNN